MNRQQIIDQINSLPTNIVDSKAEKVAAAIEAAAAAVEAAGLFLVKGSTSPSSKKSFARLYLQRTPNASHDHRHSDYDKNVIGVWEWETRTKYGFKRISAQSLIEACNAIVEEAR